MQLNSNGYSDDLCEPAERIAARRRSVEHMKEVRRKRIARNVMVVILMVLAFCSGFFGRGLLSAHAEEEIIPELNCYYGSIQIRRGDSLWDIARTYSPNTDYSTQEYVEELKRLNKLDSEEIHAGQYLTVVYCE